MLLLGQRKDESRLNISHAQPALLADQFEEKLCHLQRSPKAARGSQFAQVDHRPKNSTVPLRAARQDQPGPPERDRVQPAGETGAVALKREHLLGLRLRPVILPTL